MKFRTMLLASAAVMFATSASAADITNPFFLPMQGKVLSDTSVDYSRLKMDDGVYEEADKNLVASEELTYGVTDNFSLVGRIRNHFDVDEEYNNDHNFDYKIGAKYNYNYGKVLTQVGVAYNTFDPRSWYGTSGEGEEYRTNRWAKALEGEIKLGYAYDCGLTPYTSFKINGTIDQSAREQDYSWFLGAHKLLDKVALDGGIRYDFGTLANDKDHSYEAWYVQAEADYFVKENVTVGVYGDYYLGGKEHKDVNYGYTIGLNAKVLF